MRERLTERVGDGIRYCDGEYTITCYPKNNNLTPVDKLAVKLCELEDKIENGTIIVLPCKVGDKVYCIQKIFDESTLKTKTIVKTRIIDFVATSSFIAESDGLIFAERDFGKTVFLDKEEAEKALAERGKNV